MVINETQLDKRRRQNRDSQRRFTVGERNKSRRSNSWGNPTGNHGQQLAALDELSASLGSNSSSLSSEHPNTFISNDYQSLLSPQGCSEGYNNWSSNKGQSNTRGEVLYRHGPPTNDSNPLPSGQMSLPPLNEQFPLHGIPMNVEHANTGRQQEQQPHNIGDTRASRKDGMLSPVSLLDVDKRIGSEVSKPFRPQELFFQHPGQRVRRRSESRAEQMIADVEKLYEFGISLSLFPEDLLLRNSLRRMKERFQSLVVLGDVSSSEGDLYDGDPADRDSDDEQEYGE
ncbi:uncharacterized protein CC84DRAFT_1222805 [Paraphaeosphaeria sporulosa]|uniref:BZIP domain-containing protein n=1 Tax=Paraphaeosphaeria sporulosa TaxID=1460663 RepID=A0A177BYM7_9PLEO|nr:uncharacterized protein CC84DRAFT_1222805 [Paraphaeosphaeria sporulosa]OAF99798.1 hypothetical protein CC84DRAFT_1222805 [Paraphaeosphaeria sporulosa]